MLPRITVNIDTTPKIFLERVAQVANDMGKFHIERPQFPVDDVQAVDLWLYHNEKQKEIMIRFYHPSYEPNQIRIEVSASRWTPEEPAYEDYVEAFNDAMCDFADRFSKLSRLKFIFRSSPSSDTRNA